MAKYTYKGLTTKKLYEFNSIQAPQETLFFFNGENCVYVNNDGSIRRGVAGGVPLGSDPYSTYAAFSVWEQN